MLLKLSLEHGLDKARAFQQELSPLTNELEIAQFFKDCGGEKAVNPYLKLLQWWENLTEALQHKLLNLPFKFVDDNLWFRLSNLNLEALQQWYDDIIQRSQKNLKKKGSQTLSPNIWKSVVSKILPSPKRTKRTLKLHQLVAEGDFQVLLEQKKYDFTPESLQELKLEVFAGVNGEIFTESLFPYLKARNLNPLDILSSGDRAKFAERQRDELEQQVKQLIQEKQEQQEEISQLKQQNSSQQLQINNLEKKLKEQQEQFNERMEAFEKFMASQNAA